MEHNQAVRGSCLTDTTCQKVSYLREQQCLLQ